MGGFVLDHSIRKTLKNCLLEYRCFLFRHNLPPSQPLPFQKLWVQSPPSSELCVSASESRFRTENNVEADVREAVVLATVIAKALALKFSQSSFS